MAKSVVICATCLRVRFNGIWTQQSISKRKIRRFAKVFCPNCSPSPQNCELADSKTQKGGEGYEYKDAY